MFGSGVRGVGSDSTAVAEAMRRVRAALGYMGVCVRLGISDGSNESVNRSIAIWYSDWVCV